MCTTEDIGHITQSHRTAHCVEKAMGGIGKLGKEWEDQEKVEKIATSRYIL